MTHVEACCAVAEWMRKQPWCQLATHEIAGSYARSQHEALKDVRDPVEWRAARDAWAASGGGQLDVVGLTLKAIPRPRIAIAEVKVSRSDLLSDLRSRKMLRYESQATECAIAVTGAMVGADVGAFLSFVSDRGLPPEWGVIVVDDRAVTMVRKWRRLPPPRGREPTEDARQRLAVRIGVSLSYRYARAVSATLTREAP